MSSRTAFVAYPSTPADIGQCIRAAITQANINSGTTFQSWEENDVAGRPLVAPIFSGIENAAFIVADVTKLNFNVTYEIGYAIGLKKRAFLVKNRAVGGDEEKAKKVGIFDTLGYEIYSNSSDLLKILLNVRDLAPLELTEERDRKAPLYLVETPTRGEAMVRIVARIKKARLQYRSFGPTEEVRLSAIDAIEHVSTSFGVLIPLLSGHMADADIHNIRAAFVAGLAHGMSKPTLILQDAQGPVPLDLRDFAKTYHHPDEIAERIQELALDVYEAIQATDDLKIPVRSLLARISIGDPTAENEFQTLGAYYVRTDEFSRAVRGEVNLVVGRKGTGKTALFAQLRDQVRHDKQNIVVDLKPEGYQLIKLKENVLDYLADGAKAHLITAFWECLLLLEVCYKILEKDQKRHLRDHDIYDPYRRLQNLYYGGPNVFEGDFSERLLKLSAEISQEYRSQFGAREDVRLTADEVTRLIHSHYLRDIMDNLSRYLKHKGSTWILFDNLDKGWSSHGLADGDIIILRCLIDASRKIQRDLRRHELNFHSIVFIRNDVYQLLMEGTPDFGKEMRASLDWSDSDLLREVLRRRLVRAELPKNAEFRQIWGNLCVSHYRGEETSQYWIDRSLMRPRNLLKIFNHCRGSAVNLEHDRIEAEDIEKGLLNYSIDLIIEADLELSDVEPSASGLIYQFEGEGNEFTDDDLAVFCEMAEIPTNKVDRVCEFLLYYGFLGLRYGGYEPQYVYDFGYDMKMINTVIAKHKGGLRYVLNPAFQPGLKTAVVG